MPKVNWTPMKAWTITSAVAGNNREELANFWLSAPDDSIESLWGSLAGEATRELIAQLTPTTYFSDEQIALRNRMGAFLQKGLQQPGAIKTLIANFLFSPPGQLRIANPEANLPNWLLQGYKVLYENEQNTGLSRPIPQNQGKPSSKEYEHQQDHFLKNQSNNLQEFVNNRIQLNRLLGLSNLYYIDPEDQEIKSELQTLRSELSKLILESPEGELEEYFQSDFESRYWALVRSGIQKEPLSPSEEQLRDQATNRLQPSQGGGFGTPGAINAFLVAMIFFEPGSMQVDNPETKIPRWLLQNYHDVFIKALEN